MCITVIGARNDENQFYLNKHVTAFLSKEKNRTIRILPVLSKKRSIDPYVKITKAAKVHHKLFRLDEPLSSGGRSSTEMTTHVLAFWDGKNKEVSKCITKAQQLNLPVKVINYL